MFADMPWYQKKIAGALFATPPTSSYEEVGQHCETFIFLFLLKKYILIVGSR